MSKKRGVAHFSVRMCLSAGGIRLMLVSRADASSFVIFSFQHPLVSGLTKFNDISITRHAKMRVSLCKSQSTGKPAQKLQQ